ncbi:MAG: hypothetical protein HUK22_04000, partial [Thermoguttaceae bacterium]|nr:hypothetical protein [Thermoguttaceae bacterium]
RWKSDDETLYKLSSQTIQAEPGASIEAAVWVKTKDVKGGGATICVEWYQGGKWLGGAYASGVQGTSKDWTKVSVRGRVRDDADRVTVTCYATKGAVGEALFDDVEVSIWTPPFLNGVFSDHYRNVVADGETLRVRVGVDARALSGPISDLPTPATVSGEGGKSLLSVAPSAFGPDYLEFAVPAQNLKSGNYEFVYSAKNPNDDSVCAVSLPFARVAEYPARKAYIDADRRLILDGKPFFPLGMYFPGVTAGELEVYADSAFNCLMPYAAIDDAALDLCGKAGIGVIYSVKDLFPAINGKSAEENDAAVRAAVEAKKDRPEIIAWYINDELPLTIVDQLVGRRKFLEELDPGRPTWAVLYQIDEIRGYAPTCDVIGTDPYPIPQKPAGMATEWSVKTAAAGFGFQPSWQVPQAFNWASYKRKEEQKDFRAPTFEELRNMSWAAIFGGGNGTSGLASLPSNSSKKSVWTGLNTTALFHFLK